MCRRYHKKTIFQAGNGEIREPVPGGRRSNGLQKEGKTVILGKTSGFVSGGAEEKQMYQFDLDMSRLKRESSFPFRLGAVLFSYKAYTILLCLLIDPPSREGRAKS